MIPENTYIKHLTHALIRSLDADHAVLAATIADICSHSEDGTKVISLEYLSTILGISKRTLQRQLAKLKLLQVITFESGLGKGNYGTFKKGDNFDAFSGIKGDKTDAFCNDKKVTNFAPKGDKTDAFINTDIITAAERADKRAHAAEKNAAADGELEKGSPRQRKEDKMIQQQFEEFWILFAAKDEYQNRKERCERVWYATSPERREAYIKALRAGKKHRDNPLHYLQYDTPEETKPEFPIFVNGDGSIGMALHDAENGVRPLAFVRGGLQLHINENFAYIYLSDAIAHKIRVIRTIPRQAIEQVPAELREEAQP
jgi:hypothetical protein